MIGRQRPRCHEASMNQRACMEIARQGCSDVIAQKPKHANIVMRPEMEKGLDEQRAKPTIGDGLTDDRPSHCQSLCDVPWIQWDELSMPSAIGPQFPQPGSGLNGERNLGIGICRLDRTLGPFPECSKIEPPDLPILLEGEIVQRVLAIGGLAGHQVIVVRETGSTENARSSQSKPAPKQEASDPRLNSSRSSYLVLIHDGPERDRFRSRMHPAEGMPVEGF